MGCLWLEETANSDARQSDLDTDPSLDRDRVLYPNSNFAKCVTCNLHLSRSPARSLTHRIDLSLYLVDVLPTNHSRTHDLLRTLSYDLARERVTRVTRGNHFRALDLELNTGGIFEGWGHWLASHVIPEGLQPSLDQAYPPWCLPGAIGGSGQLFLEGPMVLRRHRKQIPSWSEDLDLLVPLTGNPLGPLSRKCPLWAAERALRPLFTLPFMLGVVPMNWQEKAGEIAAFLRVDDILAYVPNSAHWAAAFTQIPKAEFGDGPVPEFIAESVWQDSGVTALWDINGNRVLWAEKFRSRTEMYQVGRSLDDWAKSSAQR